MTIAADPDVSLRPRHFLLDDGAAWTLDRVEPSPCEDALRLLALPANRRPLVDQAGTLGGLTMPTGVAVDPAGVIWLVDSDDATLKRFDPCCGDFETVPCVGGVGGAPRCFRRPRGIAISRDGLIHVADSGNRRVQVFATRGLALTGIWGPIDGQGACVGPKPPAPPAAACAAEAEPEFATGAWLPWGIAAGRHGRIYVTDRDNGLVHCFDRGGRWRWARGGAGPAGPALVAPTHIAADVAGRLYVVQDGRPEVVVLDADGEFLAVAGPPEELAGRFAPGPLAADGNGNLFIVDQATRRICAYRCRGRAGTEVSFSAGVCQVEGPVGGLAFDPEGDPLVTLPATPAGPQVFRLEGAASYVLSGAATTADLDSHIAGCQWHRVALTGSLPSGCSVRVDTYTSELARDAEEIETLAGRQWSTAGTWVEDALTDWDCMVLSPPGRHLWLRLTLTGGGTATPLIERVRVEFPRLSSIEHLPAVYRATTGGTTFLERFLSIFDTVLGSVERRLDELPGWFDPRAAPAQPVPPSPSARPTAGGSQTDFLTWLASWLALSFEGTCSEAKRRQVLARAAELYAWRGTLRGLREAVQLIAGIDLATGERLAVPGILEDFRLRRWVFLGDARLGDQTTLWGRRIVDRLEVGEGSQVGTFKLTDIGDPRTDPLRQLANRFTVFVPAACCRDDATRRAVDRIIAISKPAHTAHRLELVEPRMRVGVQATIGFDTAIGAYPPGVTTGEARVGYDAVLQDSPALSSRPRLRVGGPASIGSSVL